MFYSTQNAEKIAAKAEQKLRKELGATSSVSYTIESGKSKAPFYIDFDLPANRPTQLRAFVIKNGLFGAASPELYYTARISKPLGNHVQLVQEGNKFPRRVIGFEGDAAASAKLNANRELFKRAEAFCRDMVTVSNYVAEILSRFEIVPQPVGSILTVYTLAKSGWFGGSFDVKEFLDIAAMVERTLSE